MHYETEHVQRGGGRVHLVSIALILYTVEGTQAHISIEECREINGCG